MPYRLPPLLSTVIDWQTVPPGWKYLPVGTPNMCVLRSNPMVPADAQQLVLGLLDDQWRASQVGEILSDCRERGAACVARPFQHMFVFEGGMMSCVQLVYGETPSRDEATVWVRGRFV